MRRAFFAAVGIAALAGAVGAGASTMRPALSPPHVLLGPAAPSIAAAKKGSCILGPPSTCYVPQQLQRAYDFPTDPNSTGAGQTILIVDAYGAPDIQSDLASFDGALGIPPPPSFTIYHQQTPVAGAQGSGATFSWEVETSLDVEYAHAMAPGANIVLAVANSDDSGDLAQVETEALPQYPGAIVSQSFGGDESGQFSDPNFQATVEPLYQSDIAAGGTVLASSGDFGASNGDPTVMASYPASDPMVLAVGGTEGHPYPDGLVKKDGGYGNEEAWNESAFDGAGGGAPSTIFAAPAWQQGITGVSTRAEPDVSYNAAVNGGVVVVLSCAPDANQFAIAGCDPSNPLAGVVGGTSAGSPQWAAIVALVNQARGQQAKPPVGEIAPLLYGLAADKNTYRNDFHDIVTGNNQLVGTDIGFKAGPGYDLATGLGSPDVTDLLGDLVKGPRGPEPPPPPPAPHGPHGGHGHGDPGK